MNRVRDNVATLLTKSANYTCVQTIDRAYYSTEDKRAAGCSASETKPEERKEVMHDRLRLDVAVSENHEIYSWHGENRFSSSEISGIVQSGPISSGSFVGYLQNVFVSPGTRFTFSSTGQAPTNKIYTFDYAVPLASSRCRIATPHGGVIVAYHGTFTVSATDYRLLTFKVVPDAIPPEAPICSAETEIQYEHLAIADGISLIPTKYVMKINDRSNIYTISRSEYTQCRQFRGESTLRFDVAAQPAGTGPADPKKDTEWLPAGLTLHVALRSDVDDRTSYVGDAVEGQLLEAVQIPGKDSIPRGALLRGVVIELDHLYDPWKHYLVSIEFQHLSFGGHSFLLRALPITPQKSREELAEIYEGTIPAGIEEQARRGVFASRSAHIHLDRRFSADWITGTRPQEASASRR
ncbi:MAG: hypothetical protein JO091_12325 [Acidobacteriaceae bacterium]|nr:hypothetical protein [Acidobacteriaceae bacterium]